MPKQMRTPDHLSPLKSFSVIKGGGDRACISTQPIINKTSKEAGGTRTFYCTHLHMDVWWQSINVFLICGHFLSFCTYSLSVIIYENYSFWTLAPVITDITYKSESLFTGKTFVYTYVLIFNITVFFLYLHF